MQEQRKALVEVDHLNMWFPVTKGALLKRKVADFKAVNDVSFTIHEGETLGLVGESGCGKTTTGRCILGFQQPTSGTIRFDGEDLSVLQNEKRRWLRRNMQIIFQDPYSSLNPRMTVKQIIGEPMAVHGMYKNPKDLEERVYELMELVGLNRSMAKRLPHQFSGGERQRIGIARALALNPRFIVCDEAVSALDVSIQAQIVNLFSELQKKLNLTYLFISHDLAVVRHISDRVCVMYLGHVVEIAPRDRLYESPMHPYTQALLSAVPIPDPELEATRSRMIIEGDLPDLKKEIRGCVFAGRCPYASEECWKVAPELKEACDGHMVACHKAAQRV